MSVLRKVIEIQKQLTKVCSDNNSISVSINTVSSDELQTSFQGKDIINLLKELQNCKISLEILKKTGIGKTVNTLRKASKETGVTVLCKKLIKEWKKLLDNDGQDLANTSIGISLYFLHKLMYFIYGFFIASKKFLAKKTSFFIFIYLYYS